MKVFRCPRAARNIFACGEAIFPAEEKIPKRHRRSVAADQTMESIMWKLIDILYREYCLARLQEMRRFNLSH